MTDSNHKIQIAEINSYTERFHAVCDILKHVFSILGTIFALRVIFSGLEPFFKSNSDTISAMANLIEKINISNIFAYILSAFFGAGWFLERRGKKRAIKKKSEYQKKAEEKDSYRSSSGLTSTGNTPAPLSRKRTRS